MYVYYVHSYNQEVKYLDKYEELLTEFSRKQFEFVAPYPSVARRFVRATERAVEAISIEDVNEVGLNCRELLNDYANQIYSPEYSKTDIKGADTKELLKDTIKYYTKSGGERATVDSLNLYVDKVVRELHTITHSSNVYPEHAFLCINLCISLITSIEALVLLHERKNSPIYEYFGETKCPKCRSLKLEACSHHDEGHDEMYYFVKCSECGWSDWTQ